MTQEWISVEERLPLLADSDEKGYVLAALRKDRQNGWPSQKGLAKWGKVKKYKHTHWMKIPALPSPPQSNKP